MKNNKLRYGGWPSEIMKQMEQMKEWKQQQVQRDEWLSVRQHVERVGPKLPLSGKVQHTKPDKGRLNTNVLGNIAVI